MRLDSANRSFFTLLGVALAPYLALGLLCCGVLSVVGYRLTTGEFSGSIVSVFGIGALAFVVATVLGAALGARSLWRQYRATRQLGVFVAARRVAPSGAIAAAARDKRIRVEVVDADESYSFTYGLVQPRVVVSRGLIDAVDVGELDAVLIHERYHVRNFDPIKVLIARTVPSTFFFLPALRDLQYRYLAGRELAADRSALRSCGREPLASALYRVVAGPAPATIGAAAAIGGRELLDARVTQLEQGREPDPPRISHTSMALTVAGSLAMMAGLIATVVALVGPGGVTGGVGLISVASVIGCGIWPVLGALALYRWLAAERT